MAVLLWLVRLLDDDDADGRPRRRPSFTSTSQFSSLPTTTATFRLLSSWLARPPRRRAKFNQLVELSLVHIGH